MREEAIRLNKYLADCGICSRREADKRIEEGRVCVNGRTAGCGDKVHTTDTVTVNGKVITPVAKKTVLAFYKPIGVTCSEKDAHAEKLIMDMIKYPVRVTYAGRLDKDSEGLLLLTNDGRLIDAMMRGANGHEKEYVVKVNKEITQEFLQKMQEGIYLSELKQRTKPCRTKAVGKFTFRIVLTQGVNRQIRRMCKEFGYQVISLKRLRVVNIELKGLHPGKYRELNGDELAQLYRLCGMEERLSD